MAICLANSSRARLCAAPASSTAARAELVSEPELIRRWRASSLRLYSSNVERYAFRAVITLRRSGQASGSRFPQKNCARAADKYFVNDLLDKTRAVFDVARAATDSDPVEFALAMRDDGGMHFIMETPFSIEGIRSCTAVRSIWRIRRSREGVSVDGRDFTTRVSVQEERAPRVFLRELLTNHPRYRITSPALTSSALSA